MVFNCRGLENLREVLESQKERSFQAYLSPSKKMTMRMPWSTTVWFSSAVSSTPPTASDTSPCQGWSRGTWTASHRPRAALRRSRRDSAGRRRSSSVPPRTSLRSRSPSPRCPALQCNGGRHSACNEGGTQHAMREVIGGHRSSSEVIGGHRRSSEVIGGHRNEAAEGRRASKSVVVKVMKVSASEAVAGGHRSRRCARYTFCSAR